MTKDEALDLALEALEYIHEGANNQGPHTGISWRCVAVKAEPAIRAIKQARSAPVQPMAHIVGEIDHAGKVWKPAQRPWFGLTDEDIEQEFGFIDELLRDCVYRTEAKLKERNNA